MIEVIVTTTIVATEAEEAGERITTAEGGEEAEAEIVMTHTKDTVKVIVTSILDAILDGQEDRETTRVKEVLHGEGILYDRSTYAFICTFTFLFRFLLHSLLIF